MGLEPDIVSQLENIAKTLEKSNKLKAIELYEKVDPGYLEKPEVRKFLKYQADVSEEFK